MKKRNLLFAVFFLIISITVFSIQLFAESPFERICKDCGDGYNCLFWNYHDWGYPHCDFAENLKCEVSGDLNDCEDLLKLFHHQD